MRKKTPDENLDLGIDRMSAPADGDRVPTEELDCWINGPRGWFCNVCRARAGEILPKARVRQRCPGLPDLLSTSTEAPTGHTAVASKDEEFVKMRQHGISVYPEVFKRQTY